MPPPPLFSSFFDEPWSRLLNFSSYSVSPWVPLSFKREKNLTAQRPILSFVSFPAVTFGNMLIFFPWVSMRFKLGDASSRSPQDHSIANQAGYFYSPTKFLFPSGFSSENSGFLIYPTCVDF